MTWCVERGEDDDVVPDVPDDGDDLLPFSSMFDPEGRLRCEIDAAVGDTVPSIRRAYGLRPDVGEERDGPVVDEDFGGGGGGDDNRFPPFLDAAAAAAA